MKSEIDPAILKETDKIRGLVKKGLYKAALKKAERLYQKYPDNVFVIYRYAVQYGDQVISGFDSKADSYKAKAAKLLKPLLKRLNEVPRDIHGHIKNEYYWFSSQPRKQFDLGKREVKAGKPTGYYSMGVGAWSIARGYALERKFYLANLWAKKSCAAWLKYFEYNPNYYNAWSWYARALGYLGAEKKMYQALKKAMKLSGKSVSFPEFQEVVDDNKTLPRR